MDFNLSIGASGGGYSFDVDITQNLTFENFFPPQIIEDNYDYTSFLADDPELKSIMENAFNNEPNIQKIDDIVNVMNMKSIDKSLDNYLFDKQHVSMTDFNNTNAIDIINNDIDGVPIVVSPSKTITQGPFDPPIEPTLFPSFFTTLRKMGATAYNYASRFIKKSDTDIVIPEFKFQVPNKSDYPDIAEKLINQHKEDLMELVNILNDFNPIKVDANIPWDCGDDKLCELSQLGLEILGEKRIEKFLDTHKNDTPTSSETFEDGTHNFYDVEAIAFKDDFPNATSVQIEEFPNGDIVINTSSSIPLSFKPITQLPTPIHNDLKVKADDLDSFLVSQTELATTAHNDYLAQKNITDYYLIKYQEEARTPDSYYSSPGIARIKKNRAKNAYLAQKKIEDTKWNDYAKKQNRIPPVQQKKLNDIKTLLNKLVNDTCMDGETIKKTVNDTYGDVLTHDAVQIIDENIEEKKIETKCCLQVCLNPCKYKLEKKEI